MPAPEHASPTSKLLARDIERRYLGDTTLQHCLKFLSRSLNRRSARPARDEPSSALDGLRERSQGQDVDLEAVNHAEDLLRRAIESGKVTYRSGKMKGFLITLFRRAYSAQLRRITPGRRVSAVELLARVAPEVRHRAERLVRDESRTSSVTWDAYELAAHGVRDKNMFYSAAELAERDEVRSPIASIFPPSGRHPAAGPLSSEAISRLLPISVQAAKKNLSRTAGKVLEKVESLDAEARVIDYLATSEPELRDRVERRVRDGCHLSPNRWNAFELMAYGAREAHSLYLRNALRFRHCPPPARIAGLEVGRPLTVDEAAAVLNITPANARKGFILVARQVIERYLEKIDVDVRPEPGAED